MAQYCPECGSEVGDTPFCPECGTELEPDEETSVEVATEEEDEPEGWKAYAPDSWQIGVAGVVMGLIAGGFLAWALANIGGSAAGFFIGWLGVMLFLWQKPTGVGAVGSGLYVCALLLVLVPIFFYGPYLGGGEDPDTLEEAGMAIGGMIGMVVWTFIFAIIAAVMGAIGYFFKKRQTKKLNSA